MEEKKNEKKESMFKFYAHGFQSGVKDQLDNYDEDQEEFVHKHRFDQKQDNNANLIKHYKPTEEEKKMSQI